MTTLAVQPLYGTEPRAASGFFTFVWFRRLRLRTLTVRSRKRRKHLRRLALPVLQLDRNHAAEDRQLDAHGALVLEDLLDVALHAGERAVGHLEPIAQREARFDLDDAAFDVIPGLLHLAA